MTEEPIPYNPLLWEQAKMHPERDRIRAYLEAGRRFSTMTFVFCDQESEKPVEAITLFVFEDGRMEKWTMEIKPRQLRKEL